MKVGVISDTHGLLRPEALAALQGCARIIHAGDIGKAQILEALACIAEVSVVRGNNDLNAPWAQTIPDHLEFEIEGWRGLLVHDMADVPRDLDPGIRLVITGHSHKPVIEWRGERLYLNPGSAGPRRFKLPITLVVMDIEPEGVETELVVLV